MTTKHIRIAQIGIGGYGDYYLQALLRNAERVGASLVGVADASPHMCRRLDELTRIHCPVFTSAEQLLAETSADLVTICTPIHLHAGHTAAALATGANVLCEKPLAGGVVDAMAMIDAQDQAHGRFVGIGYQWSFSDAVQALKRDIRRGRFGRPLRMKTTATYPRGRSYFRRNGWAGRKFGSNGQSVFDSPVNNATSHFLHNMLFLLGPTMHSAAVPQTVEAELYRANEIENFDTAAVRCTMSEGVEVLFYTTHAAVDRVHPRFALEFDNATITYGSATNRQIIATFADGSTHSYGSPDADGYRKIWQSIEAARDGGRVHCDVRTALPHVLTVAAIQKSMPDATEFPGDLRRAVAVGDDTMTAIEGLQASLDECFQASRLPAEMGHIAWARSGKPVRVVTPTEAGRKPLAKAS